MQDAQIPDWVPPAVKSMAAVLPVDGGIIGRRLLTDGRMRAIWARLKRVKVKEEWIDKLDDWQRLASFDVGVSLEDEARAAVFASAVVELSFARYVWTRSQIADRSARWRAVAVVCREILDNEPRARPGSQLAKAFLTVEDYLKNGALQIERRKGAYVLERSSKQRNDDELRGRVRGFAFEMHRIYGSFRYDTVAKVATIALQPKRDVEWKDVRNWCADLIP